MPGPDLSAALAAALHAARAAGDHLRAELLRTDGPRGPLSKCPADDEAEVLIRTHLLRATPGWAFRGEETGATGSGWPMWVVDPNDGTSAMQRGGRGAAVSIALLVDHQPVLGVVHAYASPLGGPDTFAWAEGCGPLRRNGKPVEREWAAEVGPEHTILVSQAADRRSAANAAWVAPARFRAMVSLAYRMALVAAGDGEVATSLGGPVSHDFAGGHALIRGVGGVVLGADGRPVRYDARGDSAAGGRLFAGHPTYARALAARDAEPALGARDAVRVGPDLVFPSPADRVADDALLDRARGCLLGQVAGDDLGARVEFSPAAQVQRAFPDGVRALVDGGHWDTLAGQPTDDSELALALARSIAGAGGFDPEAVATAYARWYASDPFDMGGTTGRALGAAHRALLAGKRAAPAARAAANPASEANGALMRVSPLAVWGWRKPAPTLDDAARADALLSHPHPVCQGASAAFCVAVAAAIREGLGPEDTWRAALDHARLRGDAEVVERLEAAPDGAPDGADGPSQGWVRIALHNAFHQLLTAPSVEEGLTRTVALGGDTDTNAAIAGALLGAVHGARALPAAWVDRVLTCRPIEGLPTVRRPRPRWCWPVDVLVLAERLVRLGAG